MSDRRGRPPLTDLDRARRDAFYREESETQERNPKVFRSEEPNSRVYARAVSAVITEAKRGLSTADSKALAEFVRQGLEH